MMQLSRAPFPIVWHLIFGDTEDRRRQLLVFRASTMRLGNLSVQVGWGMQQNGLFNSPALRSGISRGDEVRGEMKRDKVFFFAA
jgi:hypothetical protein